MSQYPQVKQVKDQYIQEILAKPNVVGVGIGYKNQNGVKTGTLSLVILVRQKLPPTALSAESMIPARFDAVETDVMEVGELRALQARTDRWRPAPGGVSIGHYQITAGTLGVVVRERTSGARMILSNNHVMANSNNANLGDPILQPGPADGGQLGSDTIAHLERFQPISYSQEPGTCGQANAFAQIGNFLARVVGSHHRLQTLQVHPQATNLIDAALARPVNPDDLRDDILEIGTVSGTEAASLGMAVRKSGRTTELTTGEILVLDATVTVSYGTNLTAQFDGQIVTGGMSQGGDSGSLLVAVDSQAAVGLLFAGSEQSTIFNPIQAVMDALEIEI
jgi:hypothetical protein